MFKRKDENHDLAVLQMFMDYPVDSANLDIWEEFTRLAAIDGGDDSFEDCDMENDIELVVLIMATKVTLRDVEYYDHNDSIIPMYTRIRNQVIKEIASE